MIERLPARRRTVVLAAHGTRSPEGRDRVRALREAVIERVTPRVPDQLAHEVLLGYVDVQEPLLDDVMREAGEGSSASGPAPPPAVLVPLFLAAGTHVREDVVRAAALSPRSTVLAHLGSWPVVEDLLVAATASLDTSSGALLLAAAGSADAEARSEVIRLGDRLAGRVERDVRVGFLGGPGPSALDLAHETTGIVSHLLLPGHFADRAASLGGAHGIPTSLPLLGTRHGLAAVAEAIAARLT